MRPKSRLREPLPVGANAQAVKIKGPLELKIETGHHMPPTESTTRLPGGGSLLSVHVTKNPEFMLPAIFAFVVAAIAGLASRLMSCQGLM